MYNLDIDIILTLSSSSHPTQQLYALNHWWTHDSLELVGEDVEAQIKDAWLVRDQHQPLSALLSAIFQTSCHARATVPNDAGSHSTVGMSYGTYWRSS